jgi:dTDP-4-dehydrorhamnose reductase
MRPGTVLVTGAAGQLGGDLLRRLPGATGRSREELDITDFHAVKDAIGEIGAELVFNCAAYNGVDQAETEVEAAFAVNAEGAANVARAASAAGARLVHFSTNYVFAGRREGAYDENDTPSPESAYGRSKRAGEVAVLAALPNALVIRSAGLFGRGGSAIKGGSFPERILGRARSGAPLRVVDDQRLNPTYTGHLAAAAIGVAEERLTGILHLVATGCCSYYELAVEVLRQAGVVADVEATSTAQLNSPASRPLNGCLASIRRPALPHWREGVAELLADLAAT